MAGGKRKEGGKLGRWKMAGGRGRGDKKKGGRQGGEMEDDRRER